MDDDDDDDDVIIKILDNMGVFWEDTALSLRGNNIVSYGKLLESLLYTKDLKNAGLLIGTSHRTLERNLPNIFPNKESMGPWWSHILFINNFKRCSMCDKVTSIDEFGISNIKYYKLQHICKLCDNLKRKEYYKNNTEKCNKASKEYYSLNKPYFIARNARRRASEKNATPYWSETEEIQKFYDNRPEGYHVDHWIPLINDSVCGLHVLANLRYMVAKDNMSKSNKFNAEEFESIL